MHLKRLLGIALIFLFLASMSMAQRPTSLEQEYGMNLIELRKQAEVNWVRDHYTTVRFRVKNHYLPFTPDGKLKHILKHEDVREELGLDQANLDPYIKDIAGRVPDALRNSEKPSPPNRTEKEEEVEEKPENLMSDSRIECVRNTAITIFDPLYRRNRWVSMVSDEAIARILVRKGPMMPSC